MFLDHYRKINSKKGQAEVRVNFSGGDDNDGDWLEQRVADPYDKTAEDNLENNELGLAIHSCINKLPEKQALVFKMKTLEGYDTETICNDLDITASNLWVIIHRARTAVAACMEKNWF